MEAVVMVLSTTLTVVEEAEKEGFEKGATQNSSLVMQPD